MKPSSLRSRLLAILIGLLLLGWLLVVVFAAFHSRTLILEQIDERLERYADMAQHTMQGVLAEPEVQEYYRDRAQRSPEGGSYFLPRQMNNADQQIIALWFGDQKIDLGEHPVQLPTPEHEGLVTQTFLRHSAQTQWRIIYRYLPDFNVWLGVGVNLDHALRNERATVWQVIIPLLFALPLTAVLLVLGVQRGLKPLDVLAERIAMRQAHALTPLETDGIPRELMPVVSALNDLLARLERALASESRFTANAAHELQTPLSAIKAEVQRCLRVETDAETRTMLQRIDTRVRRSADTVRQLLTLARLDPDQELHSARFDLSGLLQEVLADHGIQALDRQLDVDCEIEESVTLRGNSEWARILLGNLVLNAFKYADAGSEVKIVLSEDEESVSLQISNRCAPFSPEVYARLGERFFRPDGQHGSGVGLGLSITYRIAELQQARLSLGPDKCGAGFSAVVTWFK
uniref:ATP-binding protein n=1 Tax=Litorivivens sp. TaxID=2020868 RepID=UPI0035670379